MNPPASPSLEDLVEILMDYTRRLEKEKQQLEQKVQKLETLLQQIALKQTFTPAQRKLLLAELNSAIKKIDTVIRTLQEKPIPNPNLNGNT